MLHTLRTIALGAALAALAAAEDPDPKQLAEQADTATRKVQAVSYHGKVFGIGWMAEQLPVIEGTFVGRQKSEDEAQMYFDIATPAGAEREVKDTMAWNGKQAIRINHVSRQYVRDSTPSPLQQAQQLFLMLEYFHPTPFQDEVNAEARKYEGTKKVGEVECHVVYVTYSEGLEARWYWGIEDHLPYRVERIAFRGEERGARVLELTQVNTSPDIPDGQFSPKPPEGYEEIKPERRAGGGVSRPEPLKAGDEAPEFELPDLDGKTWKLAEARGKPVVLLFWNTWTRACEPALEQVAQLKNDHGDQATFVGVSMLEDSSADVAGYLEERGIVLRNLTGGDAVGGTLYRLRGCPSRVVIDKDGKIVEIIGGDGQGLEEALKRAIGA